MLLQMSWKSSFKPVKCLMKQSTVLERWSRNTFLRHWTPAFRTDLTKIIHGHLLEGQDSTNNVQPRAHYSSLTSTPQSELSEKMSGSLVIDFPTYHEGGALSLRRHGRDWIFDSGQALACGCLDRPSIGYLTFLNAIEQEVAPPSSGHRITLTYNLYFDGRAARPVSEIQYCLQFLGNFRGSGPIEFKVTIGSACDGITLEDGPRVVCEITQCTRQVHAYGPPRTLAMYPPNGASEMIWHDGYAEAL